MLTQERVKELFDYKDGTLVRKKKTSNRVCVGDVVGCQNSRGYLHVKADCGNHKVHRLIWLWHHGYMPENHIDHINRNPLDNHIENLREVGDVCNQRNTGNRIDNNSGVKGVSWFSSCGKWMARIKILGKDRYIGLHADFLEAVCHRLAYEQCLGWSGCDDRSPAYKYVVDNMRNNSTNKRERKEG